jgi:nitroreductase
MTMGVREALTKRSSVRAFKPDPIDDTLVRRLVAAALEAPSWSNTQPYVVAIANGAACDTVRRDLLEAAETRVPSPEHAFPTEYPSPLKERRQATGNALYEKLGIAREDREGRARQFRRNFELFGAPCVLFVFVHEALGVYGPLDAGFFLQSLLLAATAEGVGTCAQAVLACYPDIVRRHFDVPDGYRLLCGVSLGHAADDVVNSFRPSRLPVMASAGTSILNSPSKLEMTPLAVPF